MSAAAVNALRKYTSWIFGIAFLIGVPITYSTTLNVLRTLLKSHPPAPLPFTSWLLVFVVPWVVPLQTAVFGIAWWTAFREKRSARAFGIAASLVFLAWALLPLVIPPHFFWKGNLLILGIGTIGLVAFSWPVQSSDVVLETQRNSKLAGDGTSNSFNKAAQFAMLLAYWGTYHWWIEWLKDHDLSPPDFIGGTLALAVLGIVIVTLHESGHALVGLLLGMKLRAFLVGPFQWRIRDGIWGFRFDPKQILVTMGATGVVPTTADFPTWRLLTMLAAGVLINTATGGVALWLAYGGAAPALAGLLALFGAFSLIVAAMNLIPFRLQDYYSDGAQMYQILSGGTWADFHRVLALAGASLVSPVRPKDYDIEAIHRAGETITQGRQGLLLRLLAYSYFLDHGNVTAAGEEVIQAVSIYNTSAPDAPAEFVSSFVFSSAYIWRSAETARQWWAHFEAKKPAQNADFWLARSALSWAEGDMNVARESLEKAETLACRLPAAGAYEFERYRCSLLHCALDEASVVAAAT